MINLGILISGRGSNMESILNFLKENNIADICPKIVISSKTEAEGLKKASKFGVPTRVVSNNSKGWDYDSEIINILQEYDVNPENGLVCLAGYMRLLSPEFVRKYKNAYYEHTSITFAIFSWTQFPKKSAGLWSKSNWMYCSLC